MRKTDVIVFLIILILLIPIPLGLGGVWHIKSLGAPSFFKVEAANQSAVQYGMIELGYSSSTLVPINSSVPTYTEGDQLWILTMFNSTTRAEIFTPQHAIVVNDSIQPDTATLLFTFTSKYGFDGTWTLNVTVPSSQALSVPLTYVDPLSHELVASLGSYGFQNEKLALGFSISSQSYYGVQGCLLTQSSTGAVIENTPSSVGSVVAIGNTGNGSISISTGGLGVLYAPNKYQSTIFPSVNARPPSQAFEIWIELYYSYSYETLGTPPSFFSTLEEAGRTKPVPLSSTNEQANPVLDTFVGLRSGVYQLRVYFEVGGNLTVEETNLLMPGATQPWVSLGGCSLTSSSGTSLVVSSTVSNSSSVPSNLLLNYNVNGVGLYLLDPISVQLSGFTLFDNAFNQAPTNIGIIANVSAGSYQVVGESLFIAYVGQPVQVNYSLTFGGAVFLRSLAQSFPTFGIQETDLGRMSVTVTFNGKGYRNASLSLENDALGGRVNLTSDSQGSAVFFGPAGNYTLTVSANGSSTTRSVSLALGRTSIEVVSLNQDSSAVLSTYQTEILAIASLSAVLGIAANLWIWVFKNRRFAGKT